MFRSRCSARFWAKLHFLPRTGNLTRIQSSRCFLTLRFLPRFIRLFVQSFFQLLLSFESGTWKTFHGYFPLFCSLALWDSLRIWFLATSKMSKHKFGLKHLNQVPSLHPLFTSFSLTSGSSFKVKNAKSHLLRASFSAKMVSSGYTFLSSQILKILSIDLDTEGSLKEKSGFFLTPSSV